MVKKLSHEEILMRIIGAILYQYHTRKKRIDISTLKVYPCTKPYLSLLFCYTKEYNNWVDRLYINFPGTEISKLNLDYYKFYGLQIKRNLPKALDVIYELEIAIDKASTIDYINLLELGSISLHWLD